MYSTDMRCSGATSPLDLQQADVAHREETAELSTRIVRRVSPLGVTVDTLEIYGQPRRRPMLSVAIVLLALVATRPTTSAFSFPHSIARIPWRQRQPVLFLSSHVATSPHTSSDDSGQRQPTSNHNDVRTQREMEPLSAWARNWGVILDDALQLTEDSGGDWTLTLTEPREQGTPLLTVPSHLILTSDIENDAFLPYYDENDMRNVQSWMLLETGDPSSLSIQQMSFQQNYVPEFMLIFKLLQEVYLGKNSRWHSWWQSLPQTFSTGLYLDDVERKFVEVMAGDILHTHELQYRAFVGLMRRMMQAQEQAPVIPSGLYLWLGETQDMQDEDGENLFESLVKWAFTVVFTRSWRSPDRKHANIIPLADLANHNSQKANLQPLFRPIDGAFQFYLMKDITDKVSVNQPAKLYLSYGSCSMPARFLVLFGFCDTSAPYVDAHIDFLDNDNGDQTNNDNNVWPKSFLDQSKMVISASSGAVAEEVWIAFLYQVLKETDHEALARVQKAFQGGYTVTTVEGDQMVEALWEKYEFETGSKIQQHFEHLLQTTFAPIILSKQDLLKHPNLEMIVKYNLFMRECLMKALHHLSLLLDPAFSMEKMSTSEASTAFSSKYSAELSRNSTMPPTTSLSQHSNDSHSDSSMDAYEQALKRSHGSAHN